MLNSIRDIPPLQYWQKPQNICTILLYIIFVICLTSNFYVLFSREYTMFYLRAYHVLVAFLMFTCMIIMIEFLCRSRKLPKLDEPYEMPVPALIGAISLSVGVAVGFFYLMCFNYAFQDCDKLVDITFGTELYIDVFYSSVMILFTLFSLGYVLQRRYYGAISSNLDRVNRLYINITFCIVWIKVVIYKGYLSHEELCQRHELEEYWCPALQKDYQCEPSDRLHGTQKIWYYLHKGLLNIAVMSCASEIYPVLLILHWLACGNAEETAEHIIRIQKRGIRAILRDFVNNISAVPAAPNDGKSLLRIRPSVKTTFNLLTLVTTMLMVCRWLVLFYYSMDYNNLWPKHWVVNDAVQMVAFFVQMIYFIALFLWSRKLRSHQLDAHHRAAARGDIIILLGCCIFLFAKCLLQLTEIGFQLGDDYYTRKEAIMRFLSLIFIHATLWTQFLAIKKILAMSDKDAKATKEFLSFAALAGFLLGWIHFGSTFLETTIIHFQLDEEKYGFSQLTLISMIFTQTLFPADYLYGFTVAGCWLEVIIRYIEFGFFQLGPPHLEKPDRTEHIQSPTWLSSCMTTATCNESLRYGPKEIASTYQNSSGTGSTSRDSSDTPSMLQNHPDSTLLEASNECTSYSLRQKGTARTYKNSSGTASTSLNSSDAPSTFQNQFDSTVIEDCNE